VTDPAEYLKLAEYLKAHPERWCQGQMFKPAAGAGLDILDPECFSRCLHGHLLVRNLDLKPVDQACRERAPSLCIAEFNDLPLQGVPQITAVLRRAAQLAEAQP
jgi:hypothetical protein